MPETKADQALRSLGEVVNFLEFGDARGRSWLETHPEARGRAQERLREREALRREFDRNR